MFSEIKDLKMRRSDIYNQKIDYNNSSREYHNELLERKKKRELLKFEADWAHFKFVELRETVGDVHNKYLEVITQIKVLTLRLKKIMKADPKKNWTK